MSAQAEGRTSQDVPPLTALRAVAALLVFLYHFPPTGLGYLVDVVASQEHVGVTVFCSVLPSRDQNLTLVKPSSLRHNNIPGINTKQASAACRCGVCGQPGHVAHT